MYPKVLLFIDDVWSAGASSRARDVINPATGDVIGSVPQAEKPDLDRALAAVERGFQVWGATSAFNRYKILRKDADLLRTRLNEIAPVLTQEEGKSIPEANLELNASADVLDWFAEEGRRAYGRLIPARAEGIYQFVVKEPIGPVAAFHTMELSRQPGGPQLAFACIGSTIARAHQKAAGARPSKPAS